jgi:hypothetical protein
MKTCKGCGLIHRKNEYSCDEAEDKQMRRDLARLQKTLQWVMEQPIHGWVLGNIRSMAGKAIKPRKNPFA